MEMGVRIVAADAEPASDPALAIAVTAARQAGTRTARLAARIDARRAPGDAVTSGSFHDAVARAPSSTFVKPGFTVAF